MANLSVPQLLQLIAAPKNKGLIQACWEQHQRQKYHVEPVSKPNSLPKFAHDDFMQWVRGVLPNDKFEQFKKFYRMPVPTVDISEKVHTELGRALEAENQYVKAEFGSPENATDFEAYRSIIGDTTFWQTEGMEAVKTHINSVLIVDLPQTQLNPKPEPYYFLLEICPANIHDVDFEKNGEAEYIIFKEGRNTLFAYDDSFYRKFEKPDNAAVWQLTLEVRHSTFNEATGQLIAGLGYCPARRFWDELMGANTLEAKAPLSKVFGRLDEYIFDFVSLRYFAAYGAWPIMWEYENSEPKHQYPHQFGIVCTKGFFAVPQPNAVITGLGGKSESIAMQPVMIACEECTKGRYSGPGTLKRISPPTDKTDSDLRNPMGFINPDTNVLEAARKALKDAKTEIVLAVTGYGGAMAGVSKMARNEMDVAASFEDKQSYLLRFKENFESAHSWVIETLCLLRYGTDYLRCNVDKGDEFYLKSSGELAKEYTEGKTAGLPSYLLAPIRDSISETKYRNNDEQRMRQRILSNLEEYPDRSDAELQAWVTAVPQALNVRALMIKLNFDTYVRRFEREQQMSVVDFGSKVAFDTKIAAIKDSFMQYATEDAKGALPAVAAPITVPTIKPNAAAPVA